MVNYLHSRGVLFSHQILCNESRCQKNAIRHDIYRLQTKLGKTTFLLMFVCPQGGFAFPQCNLVGRLPLQKADPSPSQRQIPSQGRLHTCRLRGTLETWPVGYFRFYTVLRDPSSPGCDHCQQDVH